MKNKKSKSVFAKICDIITYALFGILAIAVTAVAISYIKGDQPNFFNYKFYVIKTDSMEPTLPVGSIVIEHMDNSYENLPVGSVITFKFNDTTIPNTHRIVGYYYKDKDGNYDSEFLYSTVEDFYTVYDYKEYEIVGYRTKGDNPKNEVDLNPVLYNDIEARFITRIVFADKIYTILTTPFGFLLLITIPSILVNVLQIYSFIAKNKQDKLKEELKNEEKKRMEIEEKIKKANKEE